MSMAPTSTAKLWSTSPAVWRMAALTVMFVSWWWSPWWEWTFNKQIILRVKWKTIRCLQRNKSCTNQGPVHITPEGFEKGVSTPKRIKWGISVHITHFCLRKTWYGRCLRFLMLKPLASFRRRFSQLGVAWKRRSEIKETDACAACHASLFFSCHIFRTLPNKLNARKRLSNLIHHCNGRKCMQVVLSHNLALLSWTGTRTNPKDHKKYTAANQWLLIKKKSKCLLLCLPVHENIAFGLTAKELCPCFPWHVFLTHCCIYGIAVQIFFKLYLLRGKTKLSYYDKCRCSCPCIA